MTKGDKATNEDIRKRRDSEANIVHTSVDRVDSVSSDREDVVSEKKKQNVVRKIRKVKGVLGRPIGGGERLVKTGLILRGGVKNLGEESGSRRGRVSIEKILALKNAGMKVSDIAERLGVSREKVESEININLDYVEFCGDKTQAFNRLMYSMYRELGVKDIKEMTPYQRVLSIGILYDKLMSHRDRTATGVETSIRLAIIELDKKENIIQVKD